MLASAIRMSLGAPGTINSVPAASTEQLDLGGWGRRGPASARAFYSGRWHINSVPRLSLAAMPAARAVPAAPSSDRPCSPGSCAGEGVHAQGRLPATGSGFGGIF